MIDVGAETLGACMEAFAGPATLQQGAAPPVTLRGVFDRFATVIEADGEGAAVSVRKPLFGLHVADLPPGVVPMQGNVLRVQGGTYRVNDVQPDGLGGITLTLTGRPLNETSLP